jgi:hypothetical protein
MYRQKDTRDIYYESLSVNASNLRRQFAEKSVGEQEIERVIDSVSRMYDGQVASIVEECGRDMMALERVPSPLKLFLDCLANTRDSLNMSPPSRRLIELYVSSWEDWM